MEQPGKQSIKMKVKLERMDWENTKETATRLCREAQMQLINAELMLSKAEEELSKYPKQKDLNTKNT